jgi:guanylate kinase
VARDPTLRLSRSWTTRARRQGERADAYVFVDRDRFEAHVAAGGFFEWAEFLGHLYGTPLPEPPDGCDVLLEIDLQGAQEVRRLRPSATLILLKPPSLLHQEERLRSRGDDESRIAERLRAGVEEERQGMAIADAVVVNHEIAQATAEVAGIVEDYRTAARPGGGRPEGPATSPPHPPADPDDLPEGP